jgi:O-antigen/teichoic acid export membrane protein
MSLYGPGFEKGSNAVVLITISAVLFAISTPMNNAMWSLEAVVPAMVLSFLRGGVLVMAAYPLVRNGVEGLVWANVIMSIVQTVIGLPWLAWLVHHRFRGASTAAASISWAAR